jgi:hypothetical protein
VDRSLGAGKPKGGTDPIMEKFNHQCVQAHVGSDIRGSVVFASQPTGIITQEECDQPAEGLASASALKCFSMERSKSKRRRHSHGQRKRRLTEITGPCGAARSLPQRPSRPIRVSDR